MDTVAHFVNKLRAYSTPTICNALEMISPERRAYGYTRSTLHCVNPEAGPTCGVALTGEVRSLAPPLNAKDELVQQRLEYYEYMFQDVGAPKICVMEDCDEEPGTGPFWGEFNARIHRACGVTAVVTNGSIRDRPDLPEDLLILGCGLRPSHAYIHVVGFGNKVEVFGMVVSHGDIVHADEHGAVAFPVSMLPEVDQCAQDFMAMEEPILRACREDSLSLEKLRRLYVARADK
jgi:regulator of RNase E activity RraA